VKGRTAWRANGDLGVEDVFAGLVSILSLGGMIGGRLMERKRGVPHG